MSDEDPTTYGLDEPLDEESDDTRTCDACGTPMGELKGKTCASCGSRGEPTRGNATDEGIKGAPKPAAAAALISSIVVRPFLFLAGTIAVLIGVAWLMGWAGSQEAGFSLRIFVVVRLLFAGATLVVIGVAAFKLTSFIFARPLGWGAVNTVAARITFVVTMLGLVTLVPIEARWLELLVRGLLGIGIAASGGVFVLRLSGAQLGVFLGAWVLLLGSLVPLASLIAWSFGF